MRPRLFELVRLEDENGVSGTGIVADGVEFGDMSCVLHWTKAPRSVSVFNSLADIMTVHGHGNTTRVRFI